MCGRFVLAEPATVTARFDAADETRGAVEPPDFNVAPTTMIPAVLCVRGPAGPRRVVRMLRWGLVPPWLPPGGATGLINARAETAAQKPAFRDAFRLRRCLLPADGWYEWAAAGTGRRPFHLGTGGPIAFAGLYEVGLDAAGRAHPSAAILTGAAPEDLTHLHHRVPILMPPERWDAWLDPGLTDPDEVRGLLVPPAPGSIAVHPVSPRVNDVRQNGPGLLDPWTDPGPDQAPLF